MDAELYLADGMDTETVAAMVREAYGLTYGAACEITRHVYEYDRNGHPIIELEAAP